MITFSAPCARCFAACARSRNSPVDSITTSTPSSPQGSSPGSRIASTSSGRPSTSIDPSRSTTEPGKGPRIESYLSRWASVRLSVRSFTATHSTSPSSASPRALAARNTLRPIRPNPLIPTRTAIHFPPHAETNDAGPGTNRSPARRARRRLSAPRAPPLGPTNGSNDTEGLDRAGEASRGAQPPRGDLSMSRWATATSSSSLSR